MIWSNYESRFGLWFSAVLAVTTAVGLPVPARASDRALSFTNDVVPVLTKAGCNSGACHAKAGGGQNGFQLSVLGFEPREDYEHLVKEGRGRRLVVAAPDQSLLLRKPSGQVPHGGGIRLAETSDGYRVLREWIGQGAPWGAADEPQLVGFEVQPSQGLVPRQGTQQLRTIARYSDGAQRDVTATTMFATNDPAMAEVTPSGGVHALDLSGKFSVMVRYQGRVAVFNASVPLGAPVEVEFVMELA